MKKRGLGTNAVVLTAAKIVTTTIGLVSAMLLSRFRSLEEYGTYSQILLVVNLTTAIFALGMPSSINYFLPRTEVKRERQVFLSVYYTLNSLLSIIMGLVLVILCPFIMNFFRNNNISMFIYVLAVLPWTKVIKESISHVLIVYDRTPLLTGFNIVSSFIIVLCILLVKWLGLSFREYMIMYIVSEALVTISVYIIVWHQENPLWISLNKEIIKKILKYSIPIGLSTFVGTLMIEADKLIIGSLLSTENLAIYTNAAKELPLTMVSSSFTAVLIPQMVKKIKENETTEAIALWGRTIEISYIFMAFFVTALVVFAPQIVVFLYSPKYLPGVSVFRVYSLILIIRVTSFGIILNTTGNTKYILYNSVLMLIINIILDYALFYFIGFTGPAVATLMTHFLGSYLLLKKSSIVVDVGMKHLIPWYKIYKHTLYNLVWGVVVSSVLYLCHIGTSLLEIVICIVIGVMILIAYYFLERRSIKYIWNDLNK